MNNTSLQYDVIIVGGGMVGGALACALGDSGLRIAVIESLEQEPQWSADQFDLRVSAITRASSRLFKNIGVWDAIVERRVSPFRQMHVWDSTGSGVIHFDSADLGEDTLGYIIENSVIQSVLSGRMRELEQVDIFQPVKPQAFSVADGRITLRLDSGQTLTGRLLVGADGSRSWVRQQAGITCRGWAYQQTAVVATVKTEKHHQETAWQRFLPAGPLAFLPLPGEYSSIVWSTTPEQAQYLLELDESSFNAELEGAFAGTLGRTEVVGPRAAFPLKLLHANTYLSDRVVLIGDAAHTVHPLAGQGVNLGFMDAAVLAEVLVDANNARKDIGANAVLRRYERWRKGDNLTMLAVMDGFKRLFSNNLPIVSWIRNVGLTLTNYAAPVKHLIMKHAMGLSGDLPKLAK